MADLGTEIPKGVVQVDEQHAESLNKLDENVKLATGNEVSVKPPIEDAINPNIDDLDPGAPDVVRNLSDNKKAETSEVPFIDKSIGYNGIGFLKGKPLGDKISKLWGLWHRGVGSTETGSFKDQSQEKYEHVKKLSEEQQRILAKGS